MRAFFKHHRRVIGYVIGLLILLAMFALKAAGRPVSDAEIGCVFAALGIGLIISALMQLKGSVNDSTSVPPFMTATQGLVSILFGIDWIVTANGNSHPFSTTLLVAFMAYLIFMEARRQTR